MMRKVKITVLKTTFDEELVQEYGAEGLSACPIDVYKRQQQDHAKGKRFPGLF